MKAIFALYNVSDKVREFHIHTFPLVIGRGSEAGIPLNDRWVSRRHCVVDECHGQLVVRDLGSKHGTLVNHCRVDEAPLLPGDRLSVGLSTIVASYELAFPEPATVDAEAVCDSRTTRCHER